MSKDGGYESIYEGLVEKLGEINLTNAAEVLGLTWNDSNKIEIPFLGNTYLLGRDGAKAVNGNKIHSVIGSVLAGYLITQGNGEPAWRFVPLDKLTGLAPSGNDYSTNSLETRLARHAGKHPESFRRIIEYLGGRPGGEVGAGGLSWIVELLPKIPVQLVYYEGDDEFPAAVRLLFDITSVNFLEFEFLAVLATLFVDAVIRHPKH